jgi:hypothetical protein
LVEKTPQKALQRGLIRKKVYKPQAPPQRHVEKRDRSVGAVRALIEVVRRRWVSDTARTTSSPET